MRFQKAQAGEIEPLLIVGVMLVSAILLGIAIGDQSFSLVELKDRVDIYAFFERSRSVINIMKNMEAAEVTEFLFKPKTVQLISNSTGNYLAIEDRIGKVEPTVTTGKVNSDKIKFLKKEGKIEIRGA